MARLDPWRIDRARCLRHEPTEAERRLWRELRGSREAHWRRQHPAWGYILDFYSSVARLAVELDGGQHHDPAGAKRDRERDRLLGELGILVLRFDDALALSRMRETAEVIWRVWRERVGR